MTAAAETKPVGGMNCDGPLKKPSTAGTVCALVVEVSEVA